MENNTNENNKGCCGGCNTQNKTCMHGRVRHLVKLVLIIIIAGCIGFMIGRHSENGRFQNKYKGYGYRNNKPMMMKGNYIQASSSLSEMSEATTTKN